MTAEIDAEALRRKGYAPLTMSKVFTVSGLDTILTDAEQINDSILESIETETYSTLDELFTRKEKGLRYYFHKMLDFADYSHDEALKEAYNEAFENWDESPPTYSPPSSIVCSKIYLASLKTDNSKRRANYVIFEYKVRINDSVAGERDLYMYFAYGALLETPDGVQYLNNEDFYYIGANFDKDLGYDNQVGLWLDEYNVSVKTLDE